MTKRLARARSPSIARRADSNVSVGPAKRILSPGFNSVPGPGKMDSPARRSATTRAPPGSSRSLSFCPTLAVFESSIDCTETTPPVPCSNRTAPGLRSWPTIDRTVTSSGHSKWVA